MKWSTAKTFLNLTGVMLALAALPPWVRANSFGDDVAFLKRHTEIVVLSDRMGNAKVCVSPAWQGRVMTSAARGDNGLSFGWINRELIASRQILPHINVDRKSVV